MVQAREWTGFEAVALQEAMRLSVRQFAEKLGIDTTTINNWRTGLGTVRLRNRSRTGDHGETENRIAAAEPARGPTASSNRLTDSNAMPAFSTTRSSTAPSTASTPATLSSVICRVSTATGRSGNDPSAS